MNPTAADLAAKRNPFAGESAEYAQVRQALLAEEIELQRHIDRTSALRQTLPDGPPIEPEYRFRDMHGDNVGLSDLFGAHDTLVTYFWMYGPERERPCPMCTNLLGPLAANARDLLQQVALVVIGRSPVQRQVAFAQERGWQALNFVQTGDDYPRDFGGLDADGSEWPVLAVFRRVDGKVRLFWKGEMTGEMADPGKDPRGGPDFAPLWTVLDLTPGGRPDGWYPKLDYPA